MNQELKNRINEQLQLISKEYREIIENFGWEEILEKIAEENDLYEDQVEDLFIETFLVITGFTNPDDFAYELEDRLVLEKEESEKISEEVIQKILDPLMEKILNTQDETIEDEKVLKTSLENPPASKPISFVEKKLNEVHSLSKSAVVPMPPGESYSDPYREQI